MCHAAVRVNSISIHSLHTEGDHVIFCTLFLCFMYFNPLPPHGGRPVVQHRMRRCRRHFNPLPPHGGRPSVTSLFVLPGVISIHSLRMEGDAGVVQIVAYLGISIHSLRMEGDRRNGVRRRRRQAISIHSLRMEGDCL